MESIFRPCRCKLSSLTPFGVQLELFPSSTAPSSSVPLSGLIGPDLGDSTEAPRKYCSGKPQEMICCGPGLGWVGGIQAESGADF